MSISVDDQTPPYSFVIVNGVVANDLLKWATKIAGRYMGPDKAEAYGKNIKRSRRIKNHFVPF